MKQSYLFTNRIADNKMWYLYTEGILFSCEEMKFTGKEKDTEITISELRTKSAYSLSYIVYSWYIHVCKWI